MFIFILQGLRATLKLRGLVKASMVGGTVGSITPPGEICLARMAYHSSMAESWVSWLCGGELTECSLERVFSSMKANDIFLDEVAFNFVSTFLACRRVAVGVAVLFCGSCCCLGEGLVWSCFGVVASGCLGGYKEETSTGKVQKGCLISLVSIAQKGPGCNQPFHRMRAPHVQHSVCTSCGTFSICMYTLRTQSCYIVQYRCAHWGLTSIVSQDWPSADPVGCG